MKCKLCGNQSKLVYSELIYMAKFKANMFQCETCELLQLDKVYWLENAYAESIAVTDTGLVARNIDLSKKVLVLLSSINSNLIFPVFILRFLKMFIKFFASVFFKSYEREILDYGGGYGLLVRLLRDSGLKAYWSDPYTENKFSKGFGSETKGHFDAVVSFEVLEHLENPISQFDILLKNENISFLIFSTELYGERVPDLSWWYFSFATGQHITFYNKKTLSFIAKKYGLYYFSISSSFHVFTRQKVNSKSIKFLVERSDYFAPAVSRLYQSLTWSDHHLMMESITPKK
ncbi:class I SAM-dependent methyltransferase [Leptospira kanakyensis]|uniref:Class I SAM-dependent methyltransferase n=2 Tax=Leptospira kanakyensis TaxID=2484968 RepID=A0A6N4QJQ9_9LEPT|nr:class I SAM-dependent methyltransferase [Leptospira kanakyensis]TGK53394.1 class I SAM-dependent methyltransferase [Leptospira kanakyensis]TGK57190.1 class I SAM-dependent methyltransferase [Leptospira kanakyensis]TGK72900.1 class I SAM-dependent methyltransferase [Leptospira kanakyensis]